MIDYVHDLFFRQSSFADRTMVTMQGLALLKLLVKPWQNLCLYLE